jgi:hypothetical protein
MHFIGRHPVRVVFLAALTAFVALALGSAARADASGRVFDTVPSTQLINAANANEFGPNVAMEAAADGTVLMRPSRPENLRQRWEKLPGAFGGALYKNRGLGGCLVVVPGADFDSLRIGACTGKSTNWTRRNIVVGNGAFALANVQTNQLAIRFPLFQPEDAETPLLLAGDVFAPGDNAPYTEWFGT